MIRETLFEISAAEPYRPAIPVYGYRFGGGEKVLAVMGAVRGDEIQQMYTAARLIQRLEPLEESGALSQDCGILVVPAASQFSVNAGRRFWPLDNTDINRMFPGYNLGETTQRLAARIFEALQGYHWGVHLTSFYLPGDFTPHARVIETGFQPNEEALDFGLPYLVIRKAHPYDTVTLNYNWQLWGVHTFSLYTRATTMIDEKSADEVVDGILRFLAAHGYLETELPEGKKTVQVEEKSLISVRTHTGGLLLHRAMPMTKVKEGDVLGEIISPFTAEVKERLLAPADGEVFFSTHQEAISGETVAFRLIPQA